MAANMNPEILLALAKDHGCTRLLAKRMAPNDNSKNQIYLGGDFSALNLIPFGPMTTDASARGGGRRDRMKASVNLFWLLPNGATEPAPAANLILYPKYPEVRLSGILKGVKHPHPAAVVANRDHGRWLFLAISNTGAVYAHAARGDSNAALWAERLATQSPCSGVFMDLTDRLRGNEPDIRQRLRSIAAKGWIESKRLAADGIMRPCQAENCGGYTLEAELGMRPNGRSEPDFSGWEVKQFAVSNLAAPTGGPVTMFTPEPDGGLYRERGVTEFLNTYGHPNTKGIAGRIDFGGIHRVGLVHPSTGLALSLHGWDAARGRIDDADGGIHLTGADGTIAAAWSFRSLMEHWKRKHAHAVYVPSLQRIEPRAYRYGSRVLAGTGADFGRVLAALCSGRVYYDPAVKLEQAGPNTRTKRRSQFRVHFRDIPMLYAMTEWWDLHA